MALSNDRSTPEQQTELLHRRELQRVTPDPDLKIRKLHRKAADCLWQVDPIAATAATKLGGNVNCGLP